MQQTAYARIAYERQARRKGAGGSVRRAKTLIDLLKDFLRALTIFLFNQVGVCFLLASYNVIGAFSFRAIEGIHGDISVDESAALAKNRTIKHIWNVTLHLNVLEEPLWRKEVTDAVFQYQNALVPLIRWKNYRGVRPSDAWTIPGSLMYSLSIITTIGYGNLTPRTDVGKIATIFYALLGMPLMLLYMSNVGEVLAKTFKFLYFRVCSCGLTTMSSEKARQLKQLTTEGKKKYKASPLPKWKSVNFYATEDVKKSGPKTAKPNTGTIPILWCLVVICAYVISGGLLFAHWEGWTILDGCYFCYISLSTVGFGDMAPGRVLTDDDGDATDVETIQILATLYLVVGMALVAMCFNLMQEEALQNIKAFWRSLGCLRRGKSSSKHKTKDISHPQKLFQGISELPYDSSLTNECVNTKDITLELQPHKKNSQFQGKINFENSVIR